MNRNALLIILACCLIVVTTQGCQRALKSVSASSNTTSSSSEQPPHVAVPIDSSYKLTFDDEFNGTLVDSSVWGIPNGTQDQTYTTYNAEFRSENIQVSNGILDLSVTQGPTPGGRDYGTAAMTSKNFLQTYGYFEARVKTPKNAHGIGSDFWMNSQNWVMPEIDIMEWLGVTPATNYMTWHYASPADGNNGTGISQNAGNYDFDNSFHVIGMLWQPNLITWYIDGIQKAQTSQFVDNNNRNPQWVILDNTVGGFNNNLIDSTTEFPSHFQIDYVHVYSNQPGAIEIAPQAGYNGPGAAQE